jgi:hypothetical protein
MALPVKRREFYDHIYGELDFPAEKDPIPRDKDFIEN